MLSKIDPTGEQNRVSTVMLTTCSGIARDDIFGVGTSNKGACECCTGKVGLKVHYPVAEDVLPTAGWWAVRWTETHNDVSITTRVLQYSTDYVATAHDDATWSAIMQNGDATYKGNGIYEYVGEGNDGGAVAIPSTLKAIRVLLNGSYSKVVEVTASSPTQQILEQFTGSNGAQIDENWELDTDETALGIVYFNDYIEIASNKGVIATDRDTGASWLNVLPTKRQHAEVTVNLGDTTGSEDQTATKRMIGLFINAKNDEDQWVTNNARVGFKQYGANRYIVYKRFNGNLLSKQVTSGTDGTSNFVLKMFSNLSGTFAAIFDASDNFISGISDWGQTNGFKGCGPIVNNTPATIDDFAAYIY